MKWNQMKDLVLLRHWNIYISAYKEVTRLISNHLVNSFVLEAWSRAAETIFVVFESDFISSHLFEDFLKRK